MLTLLAGTGLFVGLLIGCIGIGGVLLVPVLTTIGQIDIHRAIAACMLSYLFSGALGALLYARRGSINWPAGITIGLGAMPGAYLGALSATALPVAVLTFIVAILVVLTGLHALQQPRIPLAESNASIPLLTVIGLITGFGSAITGTGGPVLLIPLLLWLNYPILMAVGLGQLIQIPIAILASIGNLMYGRLEIALGIAIGVTLLIGVTLGVWLAHQLPTALLKRMVAIVLIATGAMMAWQIAPQMISW